MRIRSIKEKAPWAKRALFSAIGTVARMKIPDVAWALMHRKELFGKPFGTWLHPAMRDDSVWSRGERELFASYAAHLQDCEW